MSSTLFDYEWQFLIQMISRVNYSDTYVNTCNTLLQQMKTLIPFQNGVVFQSSRENGDVRLRSPVTTEAVNDEQDHDFFTRGNYPHWNEFIMAPYSIVFRQSDIIPTTKWEKTRVYREVWQPKNNYWGLFVSLVYKDCPLAVLGFLRSRSDEDFSARDIYILNALKDPLERKFYALLQTDKQSNRNALQDGIAKSAAQYNLTKRETEIVLLNCAGKSSEDMCKQLFITHATLSKHLTNIYAKTKVRNRTQLFGLFSKNI
ncbi:MAG: helix-turn-helix transcriptional regulator [Oscillospiraceae bacterium]|jgi:DNA-binding CsgD family transcriptional regulator|nr:helix-turn-helix transcriptional regulator [Oscillospiraceae bacterium]